jgi:hypothetical protein
VIVWKQPHPGSAVRSSDFIGALKECDVQDRARLARDMFNSLDCSAGDEDRAGDRVGVDTEIEMFKEALRTGIRAEQPLKDASHEVEVDERGWRSALARVIGIVMARREVAIGRCLHHQSLQGQSKRYRRELVTFARVFRIPTVSERFRRRHMNTSSQNRKTVRAREATRPPFSST